MKYEIGSCPNKVVEIYVTDKSAFFIRSYHIKKEDKEMKHICHLGILNEGFSVYSSPAILISTKVTQDQRVITDFKLLNIRITKTNLSYPLLKDMFFSIRQY